MSNKLLKNNAPKSTTSNVNSTGASATTHIAANANSHLNNSKDDLTCNITLLGPTGSGKSALLVKYITRRFIGEYDPYYGTNWLLLMSDSFELIES